MPLTHANIVAGMEALIAARLAGPGDRVLLPLPLHHFYPFVVGLLVPLAAGATVVFPAGLGGPEVAQALRLGAVTVLVGVLRLYAALAAAIEARLAARSGWTRVPFRAALAASRLLLHGLGWHGPGRVLFRRVRVALAPNLRLLASGGARLDPAVAWTLEALGWQVLSGYGLTETAPILAFNTPGDARIGTAGRPLPGVDLRIDTPDGAAYGEILARGPNVFSGYWRRPEETRRAFTSDGWFRTGDLGAIDADGYLTVVGRTNTMIVLAGGENVFSEEVEKAYAASPLVREIAVFELGGGLVAVVVPALDTVRARGAERLPVLIGDELLTMARVLPSHLGLTGHAIVRDPLPRTAVGKLRRHLLPDLYRRARAAGTRRTPAPLSPADRAFLAASPQRELWRWLRRRFPDSSFDLNSSPQLDLGIDSLGWVGLGMEIEQRFAIRLTEARVARIVTMRDLLREDAAAAAAKSVAAPAVVAPPPRGPVLIALAALLQVVFHVVMRTAFRLRIDGLENLPAAGPFVVAPNHASCLDPVAVAAALPFRMLRVTCFGGWTGLLFRGPVSRLFSRIANVIPVDPDRATGDSLARAAAVLAEGGVLVWFAEGRRTTSGALQPLMPGIGKLLADSGASVVPVRITGTFGAAPAPAGRLVPRLRRVGLHIGRPLTPATLRALGNGETERARIVDGLAWALAALEKDEKVYPSDLLTQLNAGSGRRCDRWAGLQQGDRPHARDQHRESLLGGRQGQGVRRQGRRSRARCRLQPVRRGHARGVAGLRRRSGARRAPDVHRRPQRDRADRPRGAGVARARQSRRLGERIPGRQGRPQRPHGGLSVGHPAARRLSRGGAVAARTELPGIRNQSAVSGPARSSTRRRSGRRGSRCDRRPP